MTLPDISICDGWVMLASLHALRYFLEVVDRGSFSGAAASLGLAQSALSRHVKELEERFGDRLLYRTGRGVVPTEFAEQFLPRIRMLCDESQQLFEDVVAARGEVAGRVRLGVLQSLSSLILTPLLLEIGTRYPRIEMHVREGLADHVEEWLASGHADLGVLYAQPSAHRRAGEFLMAADLFVIGRGGDARLTAETMPFNEVAHLPLVLPAPPNRWRLTIDHACINQSLKLNLIHELDSLQTIKDFVKLPGHFSILPLHAVQQEVKSGAIAVSKISNPEITREVILQFTDRRLASGACKKVAELIRRQIKAQIEAGSIAGKCETAAQPR